MKLENQICTMGQAKRLKDLGIIQNKSFCFWGKNDTGEFFPCPYKIAKAAFYLFWDKEQSCDAFTVAELGIMLPYNVPSLSVDGCFNPGTNEWECYLKHTQVNPPESLAEVAGDTEAEARAALLILILEVKEIDIDQVNERLTNSKAKTKNIELINEHCGIAPSWVDHPKWDEIHDQLKDEGYSTGSEEDYDKLYAELKRRILALPTPVIELPGKKEIEIKYLNLADSYILHIYPGDFKIPISSEIKEVIDQLQEDNRVLVEALEEALRQHNASQYGAINTECAMKIQTALNYLTTKK